MTIHKGEPAPGDGIWVSEEMSRKIETDLIAKDFLESDLQKCLSTKTDLVQSRTNNYAWLSSGIALGLVTSLLLNKK